MSRWINRLTGCTATLLSAEEAETDDSSTCMELGVAAKDMLGYSKETKEQKKGQVFVCVC